MEFGRAVAKAMTCAWNQHETRRCYLLATPLEDDVYNLILIALDSVTGLPEVFSCAGLKRPPEYARDWAALARSAMLDSCSEEVRFEMEMSPDGLHEVRTTQ